MTRAPSPPALGELRNPSSPAAQLAALKQLKNFIVGHDQRKELVVRRGIIPELARVLQANVKAAGKRRQRHLNGGRAGGAGAPAAGDGAEGWTQEDEERLQATLIVGSLALGGPPFVAPVLAGGLLQPLLAALSPSDAPPKLVIATLRTLISLASATGSDLFPSPYRARIANEIYHRPDGDALTEILAQRSAMRMMQEQIGLAAELISKTCREDEHRNFLVKAGALDLLAAHFAAHVAASSLVSPVAEASAIASFPPAPSKSNFLQIVSAISSVISNSNYRTARFLYSQPIVALFPSAKQIASFEKYGFMVQPRPNDLYNTQNIPAYEYLLPQLQVAQTKESSFSKAFPALGSLTAPGDGARISSFADPNSQSSKHVTGQEYETAIYAWTIRMAREHRDDERLVFIELLTELVKFAESNPIDNRSDYVKEGQRRLLAVLVIPLLSKMIDEGETGGRSERSTKAMRLMAALLEYDPILQNAAADSGIIRRVCQVLKKSFDVVIGEQPKRWSPVPTSPDEMDSLDGVERADVLGNPGVSQEVHLLLKSRECSLLALAAIAHKEDPHRKTIIESGAVACIADSLIPYGRDDEEMARGIILTGAKDGNPVPVLIAACNAARAMSRSVSVLRTSMMDYGIAKPIYGLLKHPVIDVQIATTDVLCNLLLQFSPMREDLIEAGVVKTLCEHAHSADARIRLISLWALKHLVLQADNEIKIQCLEELGTGWLINTVSGEARQVQMPNKGHLHSRPETPSLGMGTPNAAGEQVDLLNAVDEPSMDIDNDTGASGDEDDVMADSIGLLRNRSASASSTAARNKAKLRAIKDAETNPIIRAQKEELRIQEQALDFIRNLIMADAGSSPGDMIDHVLQTFGRDRFFEILTAKLRPRSPSSSGPPSSSTAHLASTPTSSSPNPADLGTTRSTGTSAPSSVSSSFAHLAPPEILLATAFIIVHLANGKPSHRQLVIAQAPLMHHLLPLFAHPDRRIRVACVWLVNNLTWIEDASDQANARQRALELRALGFEERVKLCLSDAELDVRERAKTAMEQLGKLVDGVVGGNGAGGAGAGAGTGRTSGAGGSGTAGFVGLGASASAAAGGQRGWGHDR
ncbi:armadillo repeat domain-containing protein [Macrophomina phaseolina]|uniref:Armadillo repeat domain-containing protein n=1 Tax=Macrophomina phaseolina TaxID=35725 RepID=A0ABQ8G6W8_9PEZI|nr:armadillo repeat domain-containing protein [Macrophomina phaseolina]